MPWSSIEIYRPPYSFENSRLKILSTQVGDMQYDDPFLLNANFPDRVQYACLIGVGSVTHSFDYGQRYVELMATPVGGPFNLKLWAPPLATMAPEGYYMLFLVEDRGGRRVPSKGVFVKLVQ